MPNPEIRAVITARDDASPVIRNFGASVGNIAKGVAIGQLAVQGITAALNKFKDAATFAISSAGDFEQNRIAFETMLGSAEKARKMLRDVSDFAAKTPFELPEVVTGAKQLLAYNIEAEKILPTFRALGNIAAGVGKDKLPQLILAFGQVRAATRLTGMELRQFTEAGVPMLSTLAKQMGKTEAQIQEMVSAGQIGFNEVEKALFGMSAEGGKFFNLMERQSTTFQGTISNVRDALGRLARNIIGITDEGEIKQGGIFFYLRQGAESLRLWIETNKEEITSFMEGLVNLGLRLGQTMRTVVSEIQGSWGELIAYLQNNDFVQHIFGIIRLLIIEIRNSIVNELLPALNRLGVQLDPHLKDMFKVVGAVASVAFVGFLTTIEMGITAISKLVGWLATALEWYNKLKDNPAFKVLSMANPVTAPLTLGNVARGFFRAEGGPVTGGQPYVVGEQGPEMFVPKQSGTIVPNHNLGQAQTINFNVNIGMYAGSELEKRKVAAELLSAIRDMAGTQNMTTAQLLGVR